MKSDAESKVVVSWRFTDGKLTATWLRLVAKLSASRENKPTSTGEATTDGQDEKPKNIKKKEPPIPPEENIPTGGEEGRPHKSE